MSIKNIEADVVIIAGGMSGMSASIAAAEKGASVIVLEKGDTVGGAANMGMGFFAVESHIQKKSLNPLTVDAAFKKAMEYNHWRADAKLIRKYYEQSASTVRWIEDMGVEFLGALPYFKDSEATWHIVKAPGSNKPTPRAASNMAKAMYDRALELGVDFHFHCPATEILKENGRVTGVVARKAGCTKVRVDCDCVIVCTGGFGDNPAMIEKELGYKHGEDLFSFRIPGLVGEGMKMVWAIGGGRGEMSMEMTYESPGMMGNVGTIGEVMRQPNLIVNLDGQRFMNEEIINNTPFAGNAMSLQKKRCGIAVVSDEIVDSYRKNGLDYVCYHRAVYDVDEWDEQVRRYLSGESGGDDMAGGLGAGMGGEKMQLFFAADSIENLASQAGIDGKGLRKTIAEYNAACAGAGDVFFGKAQRYMKPVTGRTFFAMKFFPSGYGSLGGIKVNDMLQVVTQDGEPIPGLYSAGTDCCSIFGDTYNFYFPGSTMGWAINSGRMAGYNAVNYLDSDDFVE